MKPVYQFHPAATSATSHEYLAPFQVRADRYEGSGELAVRQEVKDARGRKFCSVLHEEGVVAWQAAIAMMDVLNAGWPHKIGARA